MTYSLKTSFYEIYNEQIIDLLGDVTQTTSQNNLKILEDQKSGVVHIQGITQREVTCYEDIVTLIEKGTKNRHVGATKMNSESSRSHSVLSTVIECSITSAASGAVSKRTSAFNIIDLAGSERTKDTHA